MVAFKEAINTFSQFTCMIVNQHNSGTAFLKSCSNKEELQMIMEMGEGGFLIKYLVFH